MSDQVENRKVEWRKVRSCILRQFREPMKDEKERKKKDKEDKNVLSCIPTQSCEKPKARSKPLSWEELGSRKP